MRHPDRLDLPNTIVVPAPLADTLTAIGSFESNVTGHHHHIIPPKKTEKLKAYYAIDDEMFDEWAVLCHRCQHHYEMKAIPSETETDRRPLMLTFREEETMADPDDENARITTGYMRIKAYTNEPMQTEALMRLVCDELFAPQAGNDFTVTNSAFYMTPRVRRNQIVSTYVGAYVLDSNA